MPNKPKTKKDLSIVAKALKQIAGREGKLDCAEVVKAATSAQHPLHKYFTWDDTEAARKYRLIEAGDLIRSAHVEFREGSIRVVAPIYVRDPGMEGNEPGYIEAAKLKGHPDEAHKAVLYELGAAGSHLARARDVGFALGFSGEIEEMLDGVINLTRKVGDKAA